MCIEDLEKIDVNYLLNLLDRVGVMHQILRKYSSYMGVLIYEYFDDYAILLSRR